ncbi:MAG: hypothetical protein V4561_06620 [Bacteroidota bacterium]
MSTEATNKPYFASNTPGYASIQTVVFSPCTVTQTLIRSERPADRPVPRLSGADAQNSLNASAHADTDAWLWQQRGRPL